ncbi:hypothetical protein JCM8547_000057 [Rhodosporidiobolus lusitaniae]
MATRSTSPPTRPVLPSFPSSSSFSPSSDYPALQPTASLLLAWQLRPTPPSPSHPSSSQRDSILLVGGGTVAASRLYHLLCASPSHILLVAPREGLGEETVHWMRLAWDREDKGEGLVKGRKPTVLEWEDREYAGEEDLEGRTMVLTAIDQPGLSSEICAAARERRIPVNVADVPPECDFYFGSVLRRGALSVMVSTGGKGPRVAARVRRRLEKALPETVGEGIEKVGELRAGLRRVEGGREKDKIERRMEWMSRVSDRWSLAQLGEMDESMMREVLEGWERGEAKGYWDVNKGAYGGLGRVLAWGSRAGWGVCPVDKDVDGDVRKCPFVVGISGFAVGAVVGGAVTAAAVWARRR